jgi:hypothetical protein
MSFRVLQHNLNKGAREKKTAQSAVPFLNLFSLLKQRAIFIRPWALAFLRLAFWNTTNR